MNDLVSLDISGYINAFELRSCGANQPRETASPRRSDQPGHKPNRASIADRCGVFCPRADLRLPAVFPARVMIHPRRIAAVGFGGSATARAGVLMAADRPTEIPALQRPRDRRDPTSNRSNKRVWSAAVPMFSRRAMRCHL